MAVRIDIGDVELNVVTWGDGEIPVVFIHGNLACAEWFALAGPRLPARFRVFAVDWRGCGESDKPAPAPGFANYALERHAEDMLAAIRALGLERCHLAVHSSGGFIAAHMLLQDPGRFGKVLAVDPVGPMGLRFPPEAESFFQAMKSAHGATRKALALAASSLFRATSLAPGHTLEFTAQVTVAQRDLFERLVSKAFQVSDGVRFGTPFHLNRAWETGGLRSHQESIMQPHLILWGELDWVIPRADMEEMTARMPDCRLVAIPGVGHSLIIERPDLYVQHFTEFLGDPP